MQDPLLVLPLVPQTFQVSRGREKGTGEQGKATTGVTAKAFKTTQNDNILLISTPTINLIIN